MNDLFYSSHWHDCPLRYVQAKIDTHHAKVTGGLLREPLQCIMREPSETSSLRPVLVQIEAHQEELMDCNLFRRSNQIARCPSFLRDVVLLLESEPPYFVALEQLEIFLCISVSIFLQKLISAFPSDPSEI